MRMDPRQRGFSLLTVLVVLMVMLLLVAGALSFTGQEVAGAAQHVRRETMSACATAARNYIMSQIRTGAQGRAVNQFIAGELDLGEFVVRTGHMDDTPGPTGPPPAVSPCPLNASGGAMMDLTNTTLGFGGALGRQCFRIVATCIDTQTNSAREVEFQVTIAL